MIRYTGATLSSGDQWAKVTLTSFVSTFHWSGVVLRAGSTAADPMYAVSVSGAGSSALWYRLTGGTVDVVTAPVACGTWSEGDVLGAAVSGTGASTTLDIWRNPSGTFGAWGTPTCSFAAGCGTSCVDSGDHVGIVSVIAGVVDDRSFDDFAASSQ